MDAIKDLSEAAKSEIFTTIATIAGSKAHVVTAQTLLEDAEAEVFDRMGYTEGRWGPKYKTVTLPVGTTIYYRPVCGQIRAAKWGMAYRNDFRDAETVTCVKCAAKEAKPYVR